MRLNNVLEAQGTDLQNMATFSRIVSNWLNYFHMIYSIYNFNPTNIAYFKMRFEKYHNK